MANNQKRKQILVTGVLQNTSKYFAVLNPILGHRTTRPKPGTVDCNSGQWVFCCAEGAEMSQIKRKTCQKGMHVCKTCLIAIDSLSLPIHATTLRSSIFISHTTNHSWQLCSTACTVLSISHCKHLHILKGTWRAPGLMVNHPPEDKPLTRVATDFINKKPVTENSSKHALVTISQTSRYTLAGPTRSTTCKDAIHVMRTVWFPAYGWPKYLGTDNTIHFRGKEFKDFCAKNGIQMIYTTPHP